jgi:hypothetical protein
MWGYDFFLPLHSVIYTDGGQTGLGTNLQRKLRKKFCLYTWPKALSASGKKSTDRKTCVPLQTVDVQTKYAPWFAGRK